MTDTKSNNKPKSREQLRFEREAKALQKNLEKRKKQAQSRKKENKEETNGQDKS